VHASKVKSEASQADILADSQRDFVITRAFDAPRDLVFEAWTGPKHMKQWWGPRIFTDNVAEMDVRPGGAYRLVMRGDNGVEYPMTGVYSEIVKPERLVMTMNVSGHPKEWHDLVNPSRAPGDNNSVGEILMTVTFEESHGKTTVTVRQRFVSAAVRAALVKMGMNEGWSQSLDRLGELLRNLNENRRTK
jgi:uncharacterized protein YndB with AHSA1/START domain